MADLKLSPAALLSLLQWSDTLFPSGAFSHSFGLESAVDEKKVQNGADLIQWIRAKLTHQVFPCDLILLRQAYDAASKNNIEAFQKIDEIAHAMRLPREVREGGSMIAFRMIQTGAELYPNPFMTSCLRLFSKKQFKGDPAVVFGLVAFSAQIPLEAAFFSFCYLFISGQVSASLRLLPIGQQEGQRLIHGLLAWLEENEAMKRAMHDEAVEPKSFMPASEIASMQHEISKVRLFQS